MGDQRARRQTLTCRFSQGHSQAEPVFLLFAIPRARGQWASAQSPQTVQASVPIGSSIRAALRRTPPVSGVSGCRGASRWFRRSSIPQ